MRAKRIATKSRLVSLALTALLPLGGFASQAGAEFLPTGKQITPTAATGSTFQPLNPDLPGHPDFTAGQAITTATSPDGKTLLVLTSGYNSQNDAAGNTDPAQSKEYVFVYDISGAIPVKKQVLQVPNTFDGLAWNPNGLEFYVSGGPDDDVHIFVHPAATWVEAAGSPVLLGHAGGIGLGSFLPAAAGLAVTDDGKKLVVANFENDSVSVVDLTTRTKIGELDLRPGKINPADSGVPGGEYPFWVSIKGHSKAYVSSIRDREIVVLDITVNPPTLKKRIPLNGKPNKMILNKTGSLLYAATDVTDTITVVDTTTDTVAREIPTTAPSSVFSNPKGFKGSSPNSLVLSPDENTLYVTNGGTNSVAVIRLAGGGGPEVAGLIPTGWYPNSVSLNADGSIIYVVNGKSNAWPNPQNCKDKNGVATGNFGPCNAANQYVWQLTKAGFSVIPKPSNADLTNLTVQVAQNNGFQTTPTVNKVMQSLGGQIKHVIYVVKENRTYDQVLGDLEIGNGDPSIVVFPEPNTPNHHMLAREFVTLDNFYDSGEVSGDGWNWTTQARTTDSIEKTEPVNYAGRAFTYDWEGVNRNINVGYATVADRVAANPVTPTDPDLLPGTADIAAADGLEGEAGAGYLWDAALHAGLTVRNYGFFCDLTRYSLPANL
jgi:DNA-binding beta-propeller fold protein YncE